MELKKMRIDVTTDASGNATIYGNSIMGILQAVQIVQGTLADGAADITIKAESAGLEQTVLALTNVADSAIYYPRVVGNKPGDGTELKADGYYVSGLMLLAGRVKVVVAQGGNKTSGAVILYYWE